jgi:hypothetical protein
MSKYRPTGNTNRTLTDQQVMFYRGEYFANPPRVTTREIMEQTELSMVSVRRMLNGETYRNIGIAPLRELRGRQESGRDAYGDTIEDSARRFAAANGVEVAPGLQLTPEQQAAKEKALGALGGLAAPAPEVEAEDMLKELYGEPDRTMGA